MTRFIQRKIAYFGLFILFALFIEAINFWLLDFGILPEHFLLDIAFLFLIGSLFLIIPSPLVQLVMQNLFLIVMMIISFVNSNLNSISGEVFSWDMILLIKDATEALQGTSILDYTAVYIYVLLLLILIVVEVFLYILVFSKHADGLPKKRLSKKNLLMTCFIAIASVVVGMIFKEIAYARMLQSLDDQVTEEEMYLSDAYLFETLFQSDSSIKKFGSFTYYVKSVSFYLGLNGDTDLSVSILNDYLASGQPTTNEYTGISAGNNVIVILLESFEYFAIDEVLTPTLYRMFYTDGVLLSQYYAKQKTDIAEAASLFGSTPAHGSLFYHYLNSDFSFNLPNMLKANTEISQLRSFHGNEGTFYNRNNAHLWFGFDEHIDITKTNVEQTDFWINSDEELFRDQSEEMVPDDGTAFFTYITGFTTHGGYEFRTSLADEYEDLAEASYQQGDNLLSQYKRTYMAAAMDFDRAMAFLLARLEAVSALDDTTILLYSDHYAYYSGFCWRMKFIDPSVVSNPELYHLPACIYDTKLKAALSENGITQIDKFVTTSDVTPTILNLLGIEFNPLWYVGNDIFSPTESVIVSRLGGIFNQSFYTEDGETILWQATDVTEQDWADFQNSVSLVLEKTNYTNLMYEIDYFRTVDNEE